jgi:AAA domain/Domain of unknown function (DUF3854)
MMVVPGHRSELHASGLSDETIDAAGLYSATAAGVRDVLGYGGGPGLVFPYASVNGGGAYARVKLDRADPDGKRYRSPARQPNRLYIPPLLDRVLLTDPGTPLWVTEGEKKALKACQEGLACLALPGVWSWRTRDHRDRSVPIPDLEHIVWRGRTVFVVFDSDLAANASVKLAEFGLARELSRRGAQVRAIRLPGGANGAKVGLDDYLLSHSVEALCALEPIGIQHPELRPGPVAVEIRELLRKDYPDLPAIVSGGVLPKQGLAVLGGPPKVGKSSAALNLVLRRTFGADWLGFATATGRSLILQAEISERELQSRVRLMLQDLGETLPDERRIFFATHRGLRLDRHDGLQLCRRLVQEARPDLLIIDPMARFYSGDQNSAREVGRLIGALDDLIQAYGVAVLLIHHVAKPSKDEPREGGLRLRGSSALFAAVDSVLLLDKAEGGGFRLAFELRNGKEPEPMRLARTDTLWFLAAGPPAELLAVAAKVADVGLRWRDLVAALVDSGATKRTAERRISEARKAGLIEADGFEVYRPTATYRQVARGGEASTDG